MSLKVVILCGGLGTRLREQTEFMPKPLVPIGPRPILWHIMKTYAAHGQTDFLLALGYKGEMIKEYFVNYDLHTSDLQVDLGARRVTSISPNEGEKDWRVSLIDTGAETMTGGRLKRLEPLLRQEKTFLLTYGDGVTDLNISELIRFHHASKRLVTVTGVRPLARFGELLVEDDRVAHFAEKPETGDGWINGGYFVMSPDIFDYIDCDDSILERKPLERLAAEGQLGVFRHDGFWQCMDTYRDTLSLNQQWSSDQAPWKIW